MKRRDMWWAIPLAIAPAAAGITPHRPLVAEAAVLAEWSKAQNRQACAPLAFATDGTGGGRARRAQFGGGWGVAFDRPGLRSAYGLAGTGLLPGDSAAFADQRESLARQWPYGR